MTDPAGKIGFIGIGAMGTPMASNLSKAGHKLVIYDAVSGHAALLAATHEVEVARNLADLGAQCNTVITMLPDGKVVRDVICGGGDSFENCVAAGLKAGSIVIDMSSSSPVGTRDLGAIQIGRASCRERV